MFQQNVTIYVDISIAFLLFYLISIRYRTDIYDSINIQMIIIRYSSKTR